ncbi:MAG: molybdopterin molybdenumtransferase MoeA [Acidobacteria bacterium]|nr:MAG: molybdopterin molybdenumtransferase MoeA [Acidobacteriota bacterium]
MAALPQPPSILTFEEARHVVEGHAAQVQPQIKEKVELFASIGRVLAEPIAADRDYPPFRRAMRDGYALRAADLTNLPVTLEVIGEIKAGAEPAALPREVAAGQAAAIMTGAPAPDGADAVVMVEYTSLSGQRVTVTRAVGSGDNIVAAGSEARKGQVLLHHVALAASVGLQSVSVFRRPEVAILSTGDEIVEIGERPGPHQIRNSNSYSLAAQVQDAGGVPKMLGIARDEAVPLRRLIEQGLKHDLLLLTGGVSMGRYDLVEQVLAELGAEFFFTGAQIQPGRPVVFGRVQERYFFGLPGNPISTMVTFELFARPLLEALAGMAARELSFVHARLKSEIKTKTGLRRFLPGLLSGEFEQAEVELAGWHGSGDVAAMARSNCYIVIPPDRERIAAGEWVAILMR